jgi:hypothetical protein
VGLNQPLRREHVDDYPVPLLAECRGPRQCDHVSGAALRVLAADAIDCAAGFKSRSFREALAALHESGGSTRSCRRDGDAVETLFAWLARNLTIAAGPVGLASQQPRI